MVTSVVTTESWMVCCLPEVTQETGKFTFKPTSRLTTGELQVAVHLSEDCSGRGDTCVHARIYLIHTYQKAYLGLWGTRSWGLTCFRPPN
jgi:hypothetical protein